MLVALLDDIVAGAYHVEDLVTEDYRRVRELCDRYEDADLGFVDASVLAIVERLDEDKLGTLDEDKLGTLDERHFRAVRPRHVDSLRLLPEDL